MSTPATELHPCQCGDPDCHELTAKKYARGHWAKAEKFRNPQPPLLPGPDDDLDLGIIDLGGPGEPMAGPGRDDPPGPPPEPSAEDDLEPDPPPVHLHGAKPRAPRPGKAATVKVTPAIRRDINAKLQLMLFVPGKVWETRDPWCGGVFVQQLPETTDALTDIICDSPDLVAFFTGPAGGFMKYMKLILALQPVGVMAWSHHIAHTVGGPAANGQGPVPDMADYAA